MRQWILSVTETDELRKAHDAYPDSSLYRSDDLIALVYRSAEDRERWHLMLSVRGGERPPDMEDVMDAIKTLLPHVNNFVVELGYIKDGWHGKTSCFRVTGTGKVERATC